MVSTECEMSAHYSPGNLLARLNAALIDDGIDPEHPTMEALAPYDQFHGRGLEATLEIAELVEAGSADHILDIGSGIGGPARYFASRFDCGRLLSTGRMAEMHTSPQSAENETPPTPKVPRAPISQYGLGWFFNEYAGRQVVEHSGTQNGYVAWVAMLPEERLGLVILANHHLTGLNSALRSWIFDACLGRPERDWSEIVRADYTNGYQRLLREAKTQFDANRPQPTRPSRPRLSEYAGQYQSQLYGALRIADQGGSLRIRFGTRFDGALEHWKDDEFRALFDNPRLGDWLVTFTLKAGEIAGMRVKESPWAPAWYDDADDLGEFLRS